MLMDIKLSKVHLSKNLQSGGFLCNMSGKKLIRGLAIPLGRDNLPGLVSNLASHAINKFERKRSEKVAWKGFTLLISN